MERRKSLMRNYELVCIIQPDLDETAFNEVVDRVKGWIDDAGGKVDKVDVWGKRKLAYLIQKQREGQYVLLNVNLPPEATRELERNIRFLEPVMRHMLTAV
jgi:small subunit ribosomal protein S6